MENVVEVKDLVKKYGNFTAVDGITFNVKKGEIFGLLGENGAGKTTTLEIIEGLRKMTAGKVSVLGEDISYGCHDCVKQKIGVQLQSSAYYNFLTLREILDLFGSFYEKALSPEELLSMVDLKDKAKSLVGDLSGGQKQRFSIVASLVNDPELVFLDEPTTGLDPVARRNLWDLIAMIKKQGKTIILTTHYMEEAEILCDRIAIMDHGKILAMGETHKLITETENPFRMSFILAKPDKKVDEVIVKLGVLEHVAEKANHYVGRFATQSKLNEALRVVFEKNPESLTVSKASLEDLFISLTGREMEDDNV
ncbi:MAG TPA: ABC transporter ATP-binding protein [bacterium]|nr:ABC transporter ATP-binding protein [bacterium]